MTREERAELVVRVAGVVFLTATLAGVSPLPLLASLLQQRPGVGSMAWAAAAKGLAMAAVGWGLVLRSRIVAGLLGPDTQGEGREEELLRAGVFLFGVYYAIALCPALVLAGSVGAMPAVSLAVLSALFLARPSALVAWLARRARRNTGDGGLVAAGLALIALLVLVRSVVGAANAALARPAGSALPALAGLEAGQRARAFVAAGSGVAVALLALAFCGRVGEWLARGSAGPALGIAARMDRRGWVVLGVISVPLHGALRALLSPPFIAATELPVPYDVVQAAVLLGFPILAGIVARPIARRIYPVELDEGGSRAALVVALETAVTVLALYYGLLALQRVGVNARLFVGAYWPILLLLAIRGDVARWCARPQAEPEDARATRAAVLQPWLGLLGAYLLLGSLPALPARAVTTLGWLPSPRTVAVGAASFELALSSLVLPTGGLALMLAARPLARLLSYGPVLRRLGRAFWRLGWTRGTRP